MPYPAVGITKVDDDVLFRFLDDNFWQADKRKHSSAIFFLHSALGAEDVSTPQIASEKETQKEMLSVLLLHETTRICNVRRNSKHFPTNKVEFLTNKVVLRIIRTITVSRNATNDFRTENERLAYGSRLYMNFPSFFFWGGDSLNPYISQTARDSANIVIYKIDRKDYWI